MTHIGEGGQGAQTGRSRRVADLVTATLTAAGWVESSGPAAATRSWVRTCDTAVGEKKAHAYLSRGAAADSRWTLEGCYWSEGYNVLGASVVLISATADDGQVQDSSRRFAANCDRAIGQSYAVRLLHLS
jgi:hypothetical protein